MRSSALVAFAMIAACNQTEDHVVIRAIAAPAPDRIAPGVPHGGAIQRIAVAEQGDAALTVDDLGELRLWPSLDGKRPPVPIAAAAPTQIALGHAGDDLLAAILDQAGNVVLLRLGRDGSIHGRAQIDGDIACDEVIAIDDGVLVRRRDQSIERFSATGVSTGRLVVEPGEKVVAIIRRHGAAMALISWDRPDASLLRWIGIADDLHWGTTMALPEGVSRVALSPGHDRVAAIYVRDSGLRVFDLAPLPRLHPGSGAPINDGAFGFVDDDHVATFGSSLQWWAATPTADPAVDPWAVVKPEAATQIVGGEIGDHVAVGASGAALALAEPTATRWLGWRLPAVADNLSVVEGQTVAQLGTSLVWLDDRLADQHEVDLVNLASKPEAAIPVGPHHIVTRHTAEGTTTLELVDVDHQTPVAIGSFRKFERFDFEPSLGMLAVVVDSKLLRYQLDLAHSTVTKLPAVRLRESAMMLRLLDPERAHGEIAIAVSYADDGQRITIFRTPKGKLEATKSVVIEGAVAAIDATGTVYAKLTVAPTMLAAFRNGVEGSRLPIGDSGDVFVSNDGTHMAELRSAELALFSGNTAEPSIQPLWGGLTATFTADDRYLVVRTRGGLVMFDAATGERRAMACGWSFGLHDQAVLALTAEQPPVCEDVAIAP